MVKPSIVDYQPTWPAEFQAIALALRAALGPLALRVDHIGSTAVPGLPAKDVIDIQITVAALDAVAAATVVAALTIIGYSQAGGVWCDHRPPAAEGPEADWAKLFFRPPPGQRPTNTHVRVQGRPNQRYPLLFRDYLRTHPATAIAYAELKRRLAEHMPDTATYSEVKDPAVDLIYLAAEEWAAATGWEPAIY